MALKRPERTAKRERERAARELVRQREKLAAISPGGAATHPIDVPSPAVIDIRVGAMPCPQCEGSYSINDHQAPAVGLRVVDVTCRTCGVSRKLWFRLASIEPN